MREGTRSLLCAYPKLTGEPLATLLSFVGLLACVGLVLDRDSSCGLYR